ncbi:hypothetical protein AB4Z22_07720 [Paenibacillus sp. TAF58]
MWRNATTNRVRRSKVGQVAAQGKRNSESVVECSGQAGVEK